MSDDERVEGSTALDDAGMAAGEDAGDRLEGAGSSADCPRSGQAVGEQLALPGVTEELFLAAGEELAGRAITQGVAEDQVEAIRTLSLAQGAAPRVRV